MRRVEPRAVRQVISKETARTLTRILTKVVDGGHRSPRGDPRLRRRRQDGHRAEARSGDPALLARPRGALLRRLRPGRGAALRDAGDARRAQEREVGQRGRRARVRGHRRRHAALPRRAAERRHADGDPVRPVRDRTGAAGADGPRRARRAAAATGADAGPARAEPPPRAGHAGAAAPWPRWTISGHGQVAARRRRRRRDRAGRWPRPSRS